MKHVKKASDRLMRQLKAIDKEQLRNILLEMLDTYGVSRDDVPNLPKLWSVCHEAIYSERGSLICGSADGQWPTLYVKGLLRGARRVPFELLLLHTWCHECIHYLGRRVIERSHFHDSEGRYTGISVKYERFVMGFQINTTFRFSDSDERCGRSSFHYFNEGVTEILAREFFSRCVTRIRLRNVTKEQISKYLIEMEVSEKGFYPLPVTFVHSLVDRFAEGSSISREEVLKWIVQTYVAGTDLEESYAWRGFLERAELQSDFTAVLMYAREEKLEQLRKDELVCKIIVNPVFGHAFDDVVVVEEV